MTEIELIRLTQKATYKEAVLATIKMVWVGWTAHIPLEDVLLLLKKQTEKL